MVFVVGNGVRMIELAVVRLNGLAHEKGEEEVLFAQVLCLPQHDVCCSILNIYPTTQYYTHTDR